MTMTLEQRVERIEKKLGILNSLGLSDLNAEPEEPLKRVAVVVGHSRMQDTGAASYDETSEWSYNVEVVELLEGKLAFRGYRMLEISKIPIINYPAAMSWAAKEIKEFEADIAIELHFNASASHQAKGHEWLYWHTSAEGRRLALYFDASMGAHGSGFPARGVKPKESGDRGAHFLSKTHCPAVICEPFFGDNEEEWSYWKDKQEQLAGIYARAIDSYFKG